MVNKVRNSFDQAQVACEIHGGNLIEICDAELNTKLKHVVERKFKKGAQPRIFQKKIERSQNKLNELVKKLNFIQNID